ncbi:MAG: TolC family protein [Capsulimonadaceae bacterium]|nr:TolC family protein [Capsulimonadaceae bacterium]
MQNYQNGIIRFAAILAIAVASALPVSLSAQTLALGGIEQPGGAAGPVTLSLPEAIAMALNSSSALQIANRALQRDASRIQVAKDAGGPRAGASIQATHFDTATVIEFGGQHILVVPQDNVEYGFNASLPIDITGQIKAQTDVARLQALSDRFGRDAVFNSLVFSTQSAYFGLLRAQHQVQVAEASLANAQAQQKIASQQYQAGTGQRLDLLRANTQVANAQQVLLQVNNSFSLARINLNDAVGRPLNAPTTVLDVPGVTKGVSTHGISAGSASSPAAAPAPAYFNAPLSDINSIDISASIKTAVDARPELRQDLTNIQAARKSIKLARADLEPTLTLTAGGEAYNMVSFANPRETVREVGAVINIPLFDSGIAHDRIRDANDTVEIARTTYEAHKTDVAKQVRQAYLSLQNAAQQIDSANIALQQASAARDLAQTRFEGGVGLYLEVTDAQAALTAAETSQVNAVYDYLVARAQFEVVLGTPNLNPVLPADLISEPVALPATPPNLPADAGAHSQTNSRAGQLAAPPAGTAATSAAPVVTSGKTGGVISGLPRSQAGKWTGSVAVELNGTHKYPTN